MIYLDHNATTPLRPGVQDAMRPYFEGSFANPASVHAAGRETRRAVEESRRRVMQLLNRTDGELIFTGSGTEAVIFALVGAWRALSSRGSHVVLSSIEHRSGIDAVRILEDEGARVSWVLPEANGSIEPQRVEDALCRDTVLVSVQHANNETGVVHAVEDIGQRVRSAGARFFVDAIQSAGKIPTHAESWQADYVALAAHKLGGPKGVGALWRHDKSPLLPFIPGSAERGLRGGTLNVPGIVGFGAAAQIALEDGDESRMTELRDAFEAEVLRAIPSVSVTGIDACRLPNTSHLTFDPEIGRDLVLALDREGFAVSAGSACTSGSESPSHVLLAMGMSPERAQTAVRVSLGTETTREELERLAVALGSILERRLSTVERS